MARRNRPRAGAGAGADIKVDVEWLASSLMQKQADAAVEEQHRATVSSHRLSRVPGHLRDNNANGYTPGFVAIGPLHNRESRRLRPAERLKVAYLNSLISRGHPDTAQHLPVIKEYIGIVAAREKEARALYVAEEVVDIGADDFIQALVLDGCFIIEHLVNIAIGREEPSLHATPFGPTQLSVDLILAENQIPFLVLVDLIAATKLPEFESTGYSPPVLLVKLVLFYLAGEKGHDMSEALPAAEGISHILHLLHAMVTVAAKTIWYDDEPPTRNIQDGGTAQAAMRAVRNLPWLLLVLPLRIFPRGPRRRAQVDVPPSASDMERMRVQFKKASGRSGSKPVLGIASVLGPVPLAVKLVVQHAEAERLHLPQFLLEFRTAPLLLNLMAFEQSSGERQDVSAYVSFMAKLVRSGEDAAVLVAADVVQRGAGNESNEEVARVFRTLGEASGAASGDLEMSYLSGIMEPLRARSQRWADLERNYFTSLAEFLALLTIVSSVATLAQTYAAFKYH